MDSAATQQLTKHSATGDAVDSARAALARSLRAWIATPTYDSELAFCLEHPELVTPRADTILGDSIARAGRKADVRARLQRQRWLLADIRRRLAGEAAARNASLSVEGAIVQAVREAYVNLYGGFLLGIPAWLATTRDRAALLATQPVRATITERLRLWQEAANRADQELDLAPEVHASILMLLWDAVDDLSALRPAETQEVALALLARIETVYTRARYPIQWARVQNHLGMTYGRRVAGVRNENLARALERFTDALTIVARDEFPEQWALLQLNSGVTHLNFVDGERRAHIERAIESLNAAHQVYTRSRSPEDWALVHYHLGMAYRLRIAGSPADDGERAIIHAKAAGMVYTRRWHPHEWATAQESLGNAYFDRQRGQRAENLERALGAYRKAARVFTRKAPPLDWARMQGNLGAVYSARLRGDPSDNIERAIAHHRAALSVYTQESYAEDWARTVRNLAAAYGARLRGEPTENAEQQIELCEQALTVYTRTRYPEDWALTLYSLGRAYYRRGRGEFDTNLARALRCYRLAERVLTRTAYPGEWAALQVGAALAYGEWAQGDVAEHRERAIEYLRQALQVYTRDQYPHEWAMVHNNLGMAYRERLRGDRAENLEAALASFHAALTVYTRFAEPDGWVTMQRNLAETYRERVVGSYEANLEAARMALRPLLRMRRVRADPEEERVIAMLLGETLADLGDWAGAYTAYARAIVAEDILVALSGSAGSLDATLRHSPDLHTRAAYALARLGRMREAAVTLERGRTRYLATLRRLDEADPAAIPDQTLRRQFVRTRARLRAAQRRLHEPLPLAWTDTERRRWELARLATWNQANTAFTATLAQIRSGGQRNLPLPRFFRDQVTWNALTRIVAVGGSASAVVYILATPWGGAAVGIRARGVGARGPRALNPFTHLVPALTSDALYALVEQRLLSGRGRVVGGYLHAQEYNGLALLLQDWPGEFLADRAEALAAAANEEGVMSLLALAAQAICAAPTMARLVERPLPGLQPAELEQLATALNTAFLQLELQRCLPRLAALCTGPLIRTLRAHKLERATLIPCGALAAFPLAAIALQTSAERADARAASPTGEANVSAITLSVAPSAQSLWLPERLSVPGASEGRSRKSMAAQQWQPTASHSGSGGISRRGVYALGNPWPTSGEPPRQDLPWAEAEARGLASLGGYPKRVAVQTDATRGWLLRAARRAELLTLACHATFTQRDPLASAFELADGAVSLADALRGIPDLRGLRLLVLSACQTALLDLRGARDEVRSLAAGMIQAGARAVLASLWPVDDRATYLLMVRFAQEWWPNRVDEPPAAALARAQQWLRTVTYQELERWEPIAPRIVEGLRATRQADGEGNIATAVRGRGWRFDDQSLTHALDALGALLAGSATPASPRYLAHRASQHIRDLARRQGDELRGDEQPYAHFYYWAGFEIVGM